MVLFKKRLSKQLPNMSTPVTKEEVIRFERAVLKRLFNARLVDNAIADVSEQMGWPQLEELANGIQGETGEKQTGKKRKKDGSEKEGGKTSRGHALSPYTLFMSLVMDMIKEHPQNPAYKMPEKLDEAGQPMANKRGGGMAVASALWSSMNEQQKAGFHAIFKPLADTFNEETARTGVKVNNVAARIKEFRQSLPKENKQELDRILEQAAAQRASGLAGSPTSSKQQQEQAQPPAGTNDASDSDSSEDSEDEQQQQQQQQQQLKKEQEAKRLQQETKEKKKHDKEGKDGKKKKEEKVKDGKKGDEGSSKKKKKMVTSDSD